jgi:catalase
MVKVKIKFTREEATKAQRGSRGIALHFLNLGARWDWVVKTTTLPFYL